jgi:subtilisin family serine protease
MADQPRRVIAVRRRKRGERPRRPGAGEAARMLRAEAEQPLAALADAGIEEYPSAALADDSGAVDPSEAGAVVALPQTDAMIIAPKAGMSTEQVREILADEYIVMPDLDLSLPAAAAAGPPVPAGELKKLADVLPADVGVCRAHEQGNRGEGVVVAVFDTGCDADHDEFAGRTIDFGFATLAKEPDIRERRGFDTASHGTHVCGTICGRNVGVAPGVDLIVASVIESEKAVTSAARLYTALTWLVERLSRPEYVDKPVILSMSLGFTPGQVAAEDMASTMEAIRQTLRELLTEDDILPIVAIGNEGPGRVRAPGYYPEAVSVGAVDYERALWPKSGGGSGPAGYEAEMNPDVVGFGVKVTSSTSRDIRGTSWYGTQSGTSMATPFAAGVAALIAERDGVTGEALRAKLLDTALALPLPAEQVGRGIVCA